MMSGWCIAASTHSARIFRSHALRNFSEGGGVTYSQFTANSPQSESQLTVTAHSSQLTAHILHPTSLVIRSILYNTPSLAIHKMNLQARRQHALVRPF